MGEHQASGNKHSVGGRASSSASTDLGAMDSTIGASLTICETR